MDSDKGVLDVAIDRSRINGFVEESPIRATEQFSTAAVVVSEGVYLLGELVRGDQESTEGGRFRWGRREVDEFQTMQVWARVYAIDSPVISAVTVEPGEHVDLGVLSCESATACENFMEEPAGPVLPKWQPQDGS